MARVLRCVYTGVVETAGESKRYRTIWISDVHLGTRGCKAEFLLDFLKHNESDTLYLVGDIIDGWALRRTWFGWRQLHNDVVQKVLRRARKGAKVYYVPGNHDEMVRDFVGMRFGGVRVVSEAVHKTADGRRFLITHGDQYDAVIQCAKWVAKMGSWAYDLSVIVNHWLNFARRKLGYPYWSLSAYLKHRVKNALEFIAEFRRAVTQEAKRKGLDGVICGHIHHPEQQTLDGVLYINDGDWVESCTALVEDFTGRLSIVRWDKVLDENPPAPKPEPELTPAAPA
ncbi:MAG: UDP-2,3-diacylglucosamine diphosphatase [Elusimicrobia bacterium]|nr:UDP-2,3-diacylglucosamine diphosphatase [Elusimicrobiota bacterium]